MSEDERTLADMAKELLAEAFERSGEQQCAEAVRCGKVAGFGTPLWMDEALFAIRTALHMDRTRPPTLPDDRDAVIAEADLLYLVKLADWAAGEGFCQIEGIESPEEWCFRKWGELGPADGNGYSAEALATALSKHDRNEGGDDGE